jgi:hypothetical protein
LRRRAARWRRCHGTSAPREGYHRTRYDKAGGA